MYKRLIVLIDCIKWNKDIPRNYFKENIYKNLEKSNQVIKSGGKIF